MAQDNKVLLNRTTPPPREDPLRGAPIYENRVPTPVHPIPTPLNQGYSPNPLLKNTLPALLTNPDAIRQVYGRGVLVRRFWPTSNGNQTNVA